MKLTNTVIKKALCKEKKYSLIDGNGLQLTIQPNGKKIWEIRYTINTKTNSTSIGIYSIVTLKMARIRCEDFKRKLYDGSNPKSRLKRSRKIPIK